MNQIYKYLSSSGVIFYNSMQRATKKRVFEEACLAFQMSGVPHTQVFEALYARERLGNNALGAGVALPHCELEGLTRPMVTIVILQRPIHVDPTPYDNKPVDIFFFLIVPKTMTATFPFCANALQCLKTKSFAPEFVTQKTQWKFVLASLIGPHPPFSPERAKKMLLKTSGTSSMRKLRLSEKLSKVKTD